MWLFPQVKISLILLSGDIALKDASLSMEVSSGTPFLTLETIHRASIVSINMLHALRLAADSKLMKHA